MPRPVPDIARRLEEALALHRQGRLDEAEKAYRRVLKALPQCFDALHLLGMLNLQRGKAGEAHRLVAAALKINPRSDDALSNLGLVLMRLKREPEALAHFEQALALAPRNPDTLSNYAAALTTLKRPAEALEALERALALAPGHLNARSNRGNALAELGRHAEAVRDYDAVLARLPDSAETHLNRGIALDHADRPQDALAALDRALALRPDFAKAHNERGLALEALGRHADARAAFARAVALDKDYADAHLNHAHALLRAGDFARGLASYEWRWRRSELGGRNRGFAKPLWLGEFPPARKTILLHGEQGLGDTIQFARYAPLVARRGARVVLEVQPELAGILSGLDGVSVLVGRGDPLPDFDLHCPLPSLPRALGTDLATIPTDIPYLRADEGLLAKWKARLPDGARPRVALAWAGRSSHRHDRHRSIDPARLAPLLAAEAQFLSVQKDARPQDAPVLEGSRIISLGSELESFADTAAVLALADLVITVDTSVAHLAGAMGRPVWILLPFVSDWRWLLERQDSPWYPTARLFRQPALGDWDSVIACVADTLDQWIRSGAGATAGAVTR